MAKNRGKGVILMDTNGNLIKPLTEDVMRDVYSSVAEDELRIEFVTDSVGLLKTDDQPLDVSDAEVDVDVNSLSFSGNFPVNLYGYDSDGGVFREVLVDSQGRLELGSDIDIGNVNLSIVRESLSLLTSP